MEEKYFDALMGSLEDAAAFAQGDTSRARVLRLMIPSLLMRPRMLPGHGRS